MDLISIQYIRNGKSARFTLLDNLWVLLRDMELDEKWLKERPEIGVPQTVKMYAVGGGRESIPLTDELQFFIHRLTPGLPVTKFAPVMDAFNIDGQKYGDGSWNALTGEGTVGQYAKLPATLGFGGNTVRVIDEYTDGGMPMLLLETVNPKSLPIPDDLVDPYTYYTQFKKFKQHLTTVNGIMTNPFPQNNGLPVFTALISDYGLAIERDRCRRVEVPECPYVPTREY